MSDEPYAKADAARMARKHAAVAESAMNRHAIVGNSFFEASIAMSRMWSAIAQAEAAMKEFTEVLRVDDTTVHQTGAQDKA